MTKPFFIFSLPRTGSTLLQRVLMGHSKISSFAEPHFLLPFVHANKREGTITNYSHMSSYKGVSDVVKYLPNGEDDYHKYLREFSLKIYDALGDKRSIYFLDKTPAYVWIIPEIVKIFPDAKFVFLFRDPIQVYASLLSTFSNSCFKKSYRMERYIYKGFEFISDNYEKIIDSSYRLNYEDFVKDPKAELNNLLKYLELDFEDEMIDNFDKQDLIGRSKDATGVKLYTKVESLTLKKWKLVFNTKYRIWILKRFVNSLSNQSLSAQGYNKQDIIDEINRFKPKRNLNFIKDFIDYQTNKFVIRFKLNVLFAKNLNWSKDQYLS